MVGTLRQGKPVSQVANETQQPRGGYLNPNKLIWQTIEDGNTLADIRYETVSPAHVGLVVDYMSRFMNGEPSHKAFTIPLYGGRLLNETQLVTDLCRNITGLDDKSIISACKLVQFDSMCRRGVPPINYSSLVVNKVTCRNIRIMVRRTLYFLQEIAGKQLNIPNTFEGGYTSKVSSGDADYVTEKGLWDFKVSKYPTTSKHTLQILMYYLLGLHSLYHECYEGLGAIGIFNPRLNQLYYKAVADIPKDVIDTVSHEVIGY